MKYFDKNQKPDKPSFSNLFHILHHIPFPEPTPPNGSTIKTHVK